MDTSMTRTITNYTWDSHGNLISEEVIPYVHTPLGPNGVFATLNAVLGLWPLQDAANSVGLLPENLIDEAESWAAAMEAQS
jgi:hypothetical protein